MCPNNLKYVNSRMKSYILVRAITEAELLRLPLLVATVTVYSFPGVRRLNVQSMASRVRSR